MRHFALSLLLLFLFLNTKHVDGQIKTDSVKSAYSHLDTNIIYDWGESGCEGCGQKNAKYHINNKPASKASFDSASADFDKATIKCKPCYLKVIDRSTGKLIRESAQYTDCEVGSLKEYYPTGQIKTVGHYKENKTKKWKNFDCGIRDGIWKYYKEDGTLINEETWKDGKLISTK